MRYFPNKHLIFTLVVNVKILFECFVQCIELRVCVAMNFYQLTSQILAQYL